MSTINDLCLLLSLQENFGKHHLMSLECCNQVAKIFSPPVCVCFWERYLTTYDGLQFQNRIPLSVMIGAVQEAQPVMWLPNNENHHMLLHNELNFLPHR